MRRYTITGWALCLALMSGCSTLPEVGDDDCQLRAGAALAEGEWSSAFGAAGSLTGGAVTLINPATCGDRLKVLVRTPSGGVVCHGSEEWCAEALQSVPLSVTPQQLRELIAPPEPETAQ